MSDERKLVHTAHIPVRWRDLDDFGHVNNSTYFTYFEQARVEWWLKFNININNPPIGPVVVTCQCTFIKPIFFPSDLDIKVYVSPPGRSSYTIYYEIFDAKQTDKRYAEGDTKMVWVDYQAGHSVPLTDDMLAALSQ